MQIARIIQMFGVKNKEVHPWTLDFNATFLILYQKWTLAQNGCSLWVVKHCTAWALIPALVNLSAQYILQ